MNEDRVVGTAKNLGGKSQEGFGRVPGDVKSQVEGVINRTAGAVHDLYGQAKETASNISEVSAKAPSKLRTMFAARSNIVHTPRLWQRFLSGGCRLGRRD